MLSTVADLVVQYLVRSGSAPKLSAETYNCRPTVINLIQTVFNVVTVGR